MRDDDLFRVLLIAGFAVVFPVAAYYRLKAHLPGEKLDRKQEGAFILATLRPVGLAALGGIVVWLVRPAWMAWSSLPLPIGLRWAGVVVGLPAGVLLIWTFHHLGRNLTDTVVTREQATLVTSGPYRWVRHPFYLAAGMALVSHSLAMANAFVAVAGSLALALIVLRTRKEEENLLQRFGDAYREYMARTGRFLPRLR